MILNIGFSMTSMKTDFFQPGEEPDNDEIKDVYADFGLAYYLAESVHRGLCNLYQVVKTPDDGWATRPRIEEHLRFAFTSTLGTIVNHLGPEIPESLLPSVGRAIVDRNFLAHHFWYERAPLMRTRSGVKVMSDELTTYIHFFEQLHEKVAELVISLMAKHGITAEMLDKAMSEEQSGNCLEPLLERRRLRKEEKITQIYEAPMENGDVALIIQTDDGLLWQLCDAGLGWSRFETPQVDWHVSTMFANILPVHINPRPPVRVPWNFDLSLGGTLLQIRKGNSKGQLLYGIKRPTKDS